MGCNQGLYSDKIEIGTSPFGQNQDDLKANENNSGHINLLLPDLSVVDAYQYIVLNCQNIHLINPISPRVPDPGNTRIQFEGSKLFFDLETLCMLSDI